ncbi:MAG: prolyl oligopeptidase family serine peptidase [bacterium]|nr:prolyl oligopeptidase family serine peptidase [bacterium]
MNTKLCLTTITMVLVFLTSLLPAEDIKRRALKDQGKTVRYIRFPRERHGFREPRHQRMRDVEEIRWLQKYILGNEWTLPKRPKKEKKEKAEK